MVLPNHDTTRKSDIDNWEINPVVAALAMIDIEKHYHFCITSEREQFTSNSLSIDFDS